MLQFQLLVVYIISFLKKSEFIKELLGKFLEVNFDKQMLLFMLTLASLLSLIVLVIVFQYTI